ncbi:FAD-binding protein [Streptomyces sp. NPDC048290]|uniref:FAD-binding protein n=1 Tax=Streptomyces sp. NPDC048290 TaxID=3155811 RepID=UPI00342B2071
MSSLGHQLATSVLVVGAGQAGLRAAIEVAEAGVAVIAVTNGAADDVPTARAAWAAGPGPTAADTEDAGERYAAHSVRAWIADRYGVRGFHDAGRHGTRLDRQAHGWPEERRSGDRSYRRALSDDGDTGAETRRTLRERVRQLAVPVLPSVYVTRLLVDDGTVFGAYGFDLADGSRYVVHADSVILSAGGHTRIWRRTSSRRAENTGAAFRLAVEAGARLRDPEMVLFHPFGLIKPENAAGTLVSEAARGAGGVLLNTLGERFMARYDAELLELGSRGRVASASYTEIKEGRGTRSGGVWLDLSHLPRETVLSRLPQVYRSLWDLTMLDITRDPIEVAPTAQYALGGVRVRPEDHSSDVSGLFVIGQAAGAPPGAGLLEENSLMEPLVQGRIAGRAAARYSAGRGSVQRSPTVVRAAATDVDRVLAADDDHNVRALLRKVRHLMTERAGVVRDETGLAAGLVELDEIEARVGCAGVHVDICGFQDLAYAYDLRSAVLAARATLECARERRETRGCHHRSDYPDADPDPAVHLVWSPTTGVRREPVPKSPSPN